MTPEAARKPEFWQKPEECPLFAPKFESALVKANSNKFKLFPVSFFMVYAAIAAELYILPFYYSLCCLVMQSESIESAVNEWS